MCYIWIISFSSLRLAQLLCVPLCPQTAILGYTNTDGRCFQTQNLVLLIFKFYVYKSWGSGNLSFNAFLHRFVKIENLEKCIELRNQRKLDVY